MCPAVGHRARTQQPATHALDHQHSHLLFLPGGLLYQDILAPKRSFQSYSHNFSTNWFHRNIEKQYISTLAEDTQSNVFTSAAETHWSEIMPSTITFPCKLLKGSWAAENHNKLFKSWQVSKNVSASPNDSTNLVWNKKKKKGGYFSNSCATISHLCAQMQDLPFNSFRSFSCSVWKAAPKNTVISRGPLESRSQTCPSDHFQREQSFASSGSCCQVFFVSYFNQPSRFAARHSTGSIESCLWLVNKVAFVHEKETLWVAAGSRRLEEAKINNQLIWWSQTQGPSISLWFSPGIPLGWPFCSPSYFCLQNLLRQLHLAFFFGWPPHTSSTPVLFLSMCTTTNSPSSARIRAGSNCLGANSTNSKEWGLKPP